MSPAKGRIEYAACIDLLFIPLSSSFLLFECFESLNLRVAFELPQDPLYGRLGAQLTDTEVTTHL